MSESDRIRVLVVDDHELLRSGVAFALLAFEDLELAGEAPSGERGLDMCAEVRPDVVLLDMLMPGIDGVVTARAIRTLHPEVRVLVLSNFTDPDLVQRVVRAGAIGYLVKAVTADELAEAIRAANAGRPTFSPAALKPLA